MTDTITIGSNEWLDIRQQAYDKAVADRLGSTRLPGRFRASASAFELHKQIVVIIDRLPVSRGGRA